jgi:HK97 family phage major capsid protein
MTLSASLTGDAQASYALNASVLPSQAVNFRDLVPTVRSESGLYVFYKETATTNNIAAQTEGSNKGENNYALSEVKVVNDYIAGFSTFSKQMARSLPFLSTTLPRMLTRDFYKAENSAFYTTVSTAATGSTTTSATVDAEQIIDYVANLEANDCTPNGIEVNPNQWPRLVTTKPADYSGPGGFTIDANGNIAIAGIPVYKSSFITDDKVLVGDWTYAKRVVVDDLSVEFFEQDSDNVQRNLVTCRVEAREVLAIDRPDAFVYADLGNVA